MADVVTRTELEDARVDLQTIEDVVNGAPDLNGDGVVTSRLGREIKTLARLQQDYPLGGVIQFDTAAEMHVALDYAEDAIAWVTNDSTPENNIGYVKSGAVGEGAWEPFSDSLMTMLYQNVSSLQATVSETDLPGFYISDWASRVVLLIDETGTVRCVRVGCTEIGSESFEIGDGGATVAPIPAYADPDAVEMLIDSGGRAIRYVTSDGVHRMTEVQTQRLVADELAVDLVTSRRPVFRSATDPMDWAEPLAEVVHVAYYGQSWSLGFDAVAATLTQRHNTISFNTIAGVANSGVAQQYSIAEKAAALQSFIPAIERGGTGSPEFETAYLGETGAVAMGHAFWDLAEYENNLNWSAHGVQLLVSAAGEGSKSIEDLSNTSGIYLSRLKEQILRGYTIAQAAGKSYVFAAITWLQGRSDAAVSGYPALLEAMRAHVDAYAKSVTGQTMDVKLITWQMYPAANTASHYGSAQSVYSKYVGAADTYEHIICAGPSYQFPQFSATNIHFTTPGQIALGAQFGQALKRALIDGVKYQPLRPVRIERNGRVLIVRYNVGNAGSLVIDTESVVAVENSGLDILNSLGSPVSISSVGIIGPGTIKITCPSAIPSGCSLRAAATGTNATDENKWRTNIRDDSGDYGGAHRWMVAGVWPVAN